MNPTDMHHVPTEEARKLYGEFMAEANKRELSGTENFDKSVLTLSSAGLGLSVSFLKDFIAGPVVVPWVLYVSWFMFIAATLSTMASFLVSGKALEYQKGIAHRAYLLGQTEAFDEPNKWNRGTVYLNGISALTFLFALILTTVFVVTNLEGTRMTTGNYKPGAVPVTEKKGATVPPMQRPASAPAPAPAPASPPASQGGKANGAA